MNHAGSVPPGSLVLVTGSSGYVGGVIYAMLAHPSGNLLLGSAGIWQSANSGGLWTYSMSGVSLANQTVQFLKNSVGDIFVMCRNNLLATRLPYAGVFLPILVISN